MQINAIDLFCGAGGSSWGAHLAGANILAGFDANGLAGQAFQKNFPRATFCLGNLENASITNIRSRFEDVQLILASPECTNHSVAKGARRRSERSRQTAFQVIKFARALKPRWLVIENVARMRTWARFDDFLGELEGLGYHVRQQLLNAVDFNVPQKRSRLFLLCDRERLPAPITPKSKATKTVHDILIERDTRQWSPLWSKTRATATLERARRAIAEVGQRRGFLIVYYGSDGAGGWQPLDQPLRTITTLDRFAVVQPSTAGHRMRMLQIPELKKAMGMPQRFQVVGSRRDGIRMLGNGVCPPVMRAVVHSLISTAA